jgi:hypothetical protein
MARTHLVTLDRSSEVTCVPIPCRPKACGTIERGQIMPVPNNLPSLTPRATANDAALGSGFLNSGKMLSDTRRPRYVPVPVPRKPVSAIVRMPAEPEDAFITGATRSLSRRLLALNMRQVS